MVLARSRRRDRATIMHGGATTGRALSCDVVASQAAELAGSEGGTRWPSSHARGVGRHGDDRRHPDDAARADRAHPVDARRRAAVAGGGRLRRRAVIHFAYAPTHLDEDAVHGTFFLVTGGCSSAWPSRSSMAHRPVAVAGRRGGQRHRRGDVGADPDGGPARRGRRAGGLPRHAGHRPRVRGRAGGRRRAARALAAARRSAPPARRRGGGGGPRRGGVGLGYAVGRAASTPTAEATGTGSTASRVSAGGHGHHGSGRPRSRSIPRTAATSASTPRRTTRSACPACRTPTTTAPRSTSRSPSGRRCSSTPTAASRPRS